MPATGNSFSNQRARRILRAGFVLFFIPLALAGCGLFGAKNPTLPVLNSGTTRADARIIAKRHPGLPPDLKNARHTQDELRGDHPALPALTPITTPQTVEDKPK